jgi:hypothetical protein
VAQQSPVVAPASEALTFSRVDEVHACIEIFVGKDGKNVPGGAVGRLAKE